MFNPISTYRIQFHKGFTFKDFEPIITYLHELGIKTIYASPIFEAVPGSNHGYDLVNPHNINPEIGTLEELKAISKKLKALDMHWLQDIVPNHMAYHPNNAWLMDILEFGQESKYRNYFDIVWDEPSLGGKLMVPFLGNPLQEVIQNKQLNLTLHEGGFFLTYGEQRYPIHRKSVLSIFINKDETPIKTPEAFLQILEAQKKDIESNTDSNEFKKQVANAYQKPEVKSYIDSALKELNENTQKLEGIVQEQYYHLCYWRESEHHINYRRFFTVNALICLNIQDQDVFNHYHKFIKTLYDEGIFEGVRVDHIDGLFDPAEYIGRVRNLLGDEAYIVVEKILEEGEAFPKDWPVQGNTGYDFLATINKLLSNSASEDVLTRFYQKITQDDVSIQEKIFQKKSHILYEHMGGELQNLYELFSQLNLAEPFSEKPSKEALKTVLAEFLIRCPVYRYYGNAFPLNDQELTEVDKIFQEVIKSKPELGEAVQLMRNVLLSEHADENFNENALKFYKRCMQFSGPIMAKGVEDTLMYTYNRFVAHNEVGDSPLTFGLAPSSFHQKMVERQKDWPLSLNASSTHDTKRGEDVRAKLAVLTDFSYEWIVLVDEWMRNHAALLAEKAPDLNDAYLVYQTLLGFYPTLGSNTETVKERLQAYLTKALREAKTHTQYAEPNEAYETKTLAFAESLLDTKSAFWKSFVLFQEKIADSALINSFSQVVLKCTCPGIPDIYQGCELWDFSLVDPDNRRPVDYEIRIHYLQEMGAKAKSIDLSQLWKDRLNGHLKHFLLQQLLTLRNEYPNLFLEGGYLPLEVQGKFQNNILAFARQDRNTWLMVIVPLHPGALYKDGKQVDWDNTSIVVPENAPSDWTDILSGEQGNFQKSIEIYSIFQEIPIGVFIGK